MIPFLTFLTLERCKPLKENIRKARRLVTCLLLILSVYLTMGGDTQNGLNSTFTWFAVFTLLFPQTENVQTGGCSTKLTHQIAFWLQQEEKTNFCWDLVTKCKCNAMLSSEGLPGGTLAPCSLPKLLSVPVFPQFSPIPFFPV